MKQITNFSSFKLWNRALLLAFCLFFTVYLEAQPTTTVLIPFTGSTSIPCGQNSLVQAHNGSTGTYNNNADGFVVIDCGFNAAITINATYTTEASFDYIRIYNGVGTGGALLASYSGQNQTFVYNGTPGQTLTVRFQSDGSVVYAGFNLNVSFTGPCFAAPCAGTPLTNTVNALPTSICPAANSTLSLAYTYSLNGIQYQWMSSTVSPVGPFTPVANATLATLNSPTLGVTTWYAAVVTCSNSLASSTTTGQQVLVQGVTTNNVPYYEDFEGIAVNNQLPNCSWLASNPNQSTLTYISSASNNRVPNSGAKFAGFSNATTGTKYFYTNGIQMQPGITYSANIWYATEYFGYTNWTNLAVLFGSAQTPAGLQPVAQVAPAVSGPYKALGGMFTVPSSGLYYVAIRATAASGSAPYLSYDDVSVTIPCTPASGNSPTLNVGVSSQTICAGDQVVLNASGADTYMWNGVPGTSSQIDTPPASIIYTIAGTNTLTGCVTTQTIDVTVNPSPVVFALSDQPSICPGKVAYLTAFGAGNYAWSNGSNGGLISVSPAATTIYTVTGSNNFGCAASGTVQVGVLQNPTVTVVANVPESCIGDQITLTANGAVSYNWITTANNILYGGSPISVVLTQAANFTVTGVGQNGCSNIATISQNVSTCIGITENGIASSLKVFPNPANSLVNFTAGQGTILGVSFVDMAGRVVAESNTNDANVTVDISNFAPGIYYATVQMESGTQKVKIVKM